MKHLVVAIIAGAAFLLPAHADAQAPEPDPVQAEMHDPVIGYWARCLTVMALVMHEEDAELKKAGAMGAAFFTGLIFGAEPDIDLTDLIKSEASDMDQGARAKLIPQCTEELRELQARILAVADGF